MIITKDNINKVNRTVNAAALLRWYRYFRSVYGDKPAAARINAWMNVI